MISDPTIYCYCWDWLRIPCFTGCLGLVSSWKGKAGGGEAPEPLAPLCCTTLWSSRSTRSPVSSGTAASSWGATGSTLLAGPPMSSATSRVGRTRSSISTAAYWSQVDGIVWRATICCPLLLPTFYLWSFFTSSAGFVNTHVHTSQQLGRGIADDVGLMTWLHERIWPYESNMTEEDSYLSTLLCGIELIRSGVSFIPRGTKCQENQPSICIFEINHWNATVTHIHMITNTIYLPALLLITLLIRLSLYLKEIILFVGFIHNW